MPLKSIHALGTTDNDFFPMPRFWFVSDDKEYSIQIQSNGFIFNWKRGSSGYPRYQEHLKREFDRYFAAYEEFVRDEGLAQVFEIDLCELLYANAIDACSYWKGPRDVRNVFRDFAIPEFGRRDPTFLSFGCRYSQVIQRELSLHLRIRNGRRATESAKPALLFEIRAAGRLGGKTKAAADILYETAHEEIVKCFLDVTNEDMRKSHWRMVSSS